MDKLFRIKNKAGKILASTSRAMEIYNLTMLQKL